MRKPRKPGWKCKPRKSKFDAVDRSVIADALREHGALQDAAKKLGMGPAALRKLIDKHSLHKVWNEGHELRLARIDAAKEPDREKKRAEVAAELAAAQSDVSKFTGVLFNAWSIPMSEQKRAEKSLAHAVSQSKLHKRRLRNLEAKRSA